jgi:hypothetical protein
VLATANTPRSEFADSSSLDKQVIVALHNKRFFRTFGANKKRKSPAINNLHALSNRTFALFPKSIQVVDWDRLVRSFLFEAAPKVRKNRFQYSATAGILPG